jgi:hypothetical protein
MGNTASLRINVLKLELWRNLMLILMLCAGIAVFIKIAHYAASVPYLKIEPHWHQTRSGRKAMLFAQMMNLLPPLVRAIVIARVPTTILLLALPGIRSFICKIYNRRNFVVFDARGIAGLRDCAVAHVSWPDVEKIELIRPDRGWKQSQTAIKTIFSKPQQTRRDTTMPEWVAHLLSFNCVLGKGVRIITPGNSILLPNGMHDFEPRQVLAVLDFYRHDLVEKFPLGGSFEGMPPS